MATKRNSSSEPSVSSGAASARAKTSVGRKHRNAAAAERPETVNEPVAAPAVTTPAVTDSVVRPTSGQIAQLAYSYWESRGYQGGCPEEDWLRAEFELCSQLATK